MQDNGITALIVDDSRTERFWEEKALRGMGCRVETAVDGLEALKFLLQGGIAHIVLLDWAMPRMNGSEFLHEVRKNKDLDHVKVLVLSGMDEKEVLACIEDGADDYWIKGSSTQVLKKRLANMVHLVCMEQKLARIRDLAAF
ncbi:MAG: response regulator [Acidobacteriota bacterium]|nr:response regulator [Acidobacteriota bacterium]